MENLPKDFWVTTQAFTKTTYRDVYPSIDPTTNPDLSQAGKIIIITGASRGIGRGFAQAFAKAKPKGIVLVAGDEAKLKETEAEIKKIDSKIEVLPVPTNLTKPDSVESLFKKVTEKFGTVDVLVNNAGTLKGQDTMAAVSAQDWWSDFEVNCHGTFLMTQGFLKLLGSEKKGTVINMTSGAGVIVIPALSSYCLSKLVALQMAQFIGAENPNVNAYALHPGVVMTESVMDSFKRFADDTPELVGGVAVWLTSEAASFMNGRYISANWSVDELVERKKEIEGSNVLKMELAGRFGMDQFS